MHILKLSFYHIHKRQHLLDFNQIYYYEFSSKYILNFSGLRLSNSKHESLALYVSCAPIVLFVFIKTFFFVLQRNKLKNNNKFYWYRGYSVWTRLINMTYWYQKVDILFGSIEFIYTTQFNYWWIILDHHPRTICNVCT